LKIDYVGKVNSKKSKFAYSDYKVFVEK